MWNIFLVTICASVLTIVSSDPETYNIDKKDTAEDRKFFKQKSNDHHGAISPWLQKPVPSLKQHSPYLKKIDPDFGRYIPQSKYHGNSRHNREPHDLYPGQTSDDYDEFFPSPHRRGPPFFRKGPHQEPHQRGPPLHPHHRGPPTPEYYVGLDEGRGPPPHHRGPGDGEGPPPHHGGPGGRGPPPHHGGPGGRGPPPHHGGPGGRGPPPHHGGPGGIGPPPHHGGPPPDHKIPFYPHNDDQPQRPQPTHFDDNGPLTPLPQTSHTTNQPSSHENQSGTVTLPVSNRNKPSKSTDTTLPTMESVSGDNSTARTSTTEEEFILDIRIGSDENGKPQEE